MQNRAGTGVATVLAMLGAIACQGTDETEPSQVERAQQRFTTRSNIFINEIHYDDYGTDTNEAIEVVGPAGTELDGWLIELYRGDSGAIYDTRALTGTLPDIAGRGFGVVAESWGPPQPILNSMSGIALIDPDGNVVEFLSYEGSFTAAAGTTAAGLTSTDILVAESGSTPMTLPTSLAREGIGVANDDMYWVVEESSFGMLNPHQYFRHWDDEVPGLALLPRFLAHSTEVGQLVA